MQLDTMQGWSQRVSVLGMRYLQINEACDITVSTAYF